MSIRLIRKCLINQKVCSGCKRPWKMSPYWRTVNTRNGGVLGPAQGPTQVQTPIFRRCIFRCICDEVDIIQCLWRVFMQSRRWNIFSGINGFISFFICMSYAWLGNLTYLCNWRKVQVEVRIFIGNSKRTNRVRKKRVPGIGGKKFGA